MNCQELHAMLFVAAGVTAGCQPNNSRVASPPAETGPAATPAGSWTTTTTRLEANAKLSRADAEKIALTRAPGGHIKEAELEQEHGKLVWSFDIATPGTNDITEVQVDAVAGEIVSVEKETAAQQTAEKKQDEKK